MEEYQMGVEESEDFEDPYSDEDREELQELLSNIVRTELDNANEYSNTYINQMRSDAFSYYYGDAPGFKEKRSSYISMDVFNAVENSKSIMSEAFASNQTAVKFDAVNDRDALDALVATHLVNKSFYKKNPGYEVLDNLFHDGLLSKVGVVKSWWEESEEIEDEAFGPIPEQQWMALAGQDPQIVGFSEINSTVAPQQVPDPQTGQPTQVEMPMVSGVLQRRIDTSQVRMAVVRPENFVCSANAGSIEDALLVGEWAPYTAQELRGLGFDDDQIRQAEPVNAFENNYVNISRHEFDSSYGYMGTGGTDEYTTRYRVYELYVRLNDQLYQCFHSNNQFVSYEEVDRLPYRMWTPFPLSHRWLGMSLADVTMAIQKNKSLMYRSVIELQQQNLYGRSVINSSLIKNPRELTLGAPGALIQTLDVDRAIKQLPVPQLDPQVFTTLESMDRELENRSGVSRVSAGQAGKDVLTGNSPSGSLIDTLSQAGLRRSEKMCRSFAETLLKPLFSDIYALITENQESPESVQVGGQFQEVVPSRLQSRKLWDMSITVALTPSMQEDQAAQLLRMHQLQVQDPEGERLYGDQQKFNLLSHVYRLGGHEFTDAFLNNPRGPEYMQEKQKVQQKTQQAEQMQMQDRQFAMKTETDKVGIDQFKAQTDRMEATGDIASDRTKAQTEAMFRGAKVRQDNERVALDAARVNLESERVMTEEQRLMFDVAKAEAELAIELSQDRPAAIG